MGHGGPNRPASYRRAERARVPLLQGRGRRAGGGASRAGAESRARRPEPRSGNRDDAQGRDSPRTGANRRPLAHRTPEALLLVVRERGMPLGRLAILAQRASTMARRWLEQQ